MVKEVSTVVVDTEHPRGMTGDEVLRVAQSKSKVSPRVPGGHARTGDKNWMDDVSATGDEWAVAAAEKFPDKRPSVEPQESRTGMVPQSSLL